MDFFNLLKIIKSPIAENWKHYAVRYCDGRKFFRTLKKGQKVEYVITAKTANEGDLVQTVTCVTNNIKATSSDGAQAEDNSQVCIEKQVLGAIPTPTVFQTPPMIVTPPSGPEMAVLALLGGTGIIGWFLRKKASK